jgi:hypothetical protein
LEQKITLIPKWIILVYWRMTVHVQVYFYLIYLISPFLEQKRRLSQSSLSSDSLLDDISQLDNNHNESTNGSLSTLSGSTLNSVSAIELDDAARSTRTEDDDMDVFAHEIESSLFEDDS